MKTITFIVVLSIGALTTAAQADESDLVWSTYLGGSHQDMGFAIGIDNNGCSYITGRTMSGDFPATEGSYDTTYNDHHDVFIAKLNASGNALEYATYLGGTGYDNGWGIAVDGSGSAFVSGYTTSPDFPVTSGAFDTSFNGGENFGDAFVVKLDQTGTTLEFSTFIGGGEEDAGKGIVLDEYGNVFQTGYTKSSNFPAAGGTFDTTFNGNYDAFVVKLNSTGNEILFATYLGYGMDDLGIAIAIDAAGFIYVTGHTYSANFPVTPSAFDITYNGEADVFVAKLSADGSDLLYATFLGGSDDDYGKGVSVDVDGNAYISGYTESGNEYPTTESAFDLTYNGGNHDAIVTKLNPSGADLIYSTFIGGNGEDAGYRIVLDGLRNAYLIGWTTSWNFPITPEAFDTTFNSGWNDAFVVKLNADGSSLVYSTYLGGGAKDGGWGIALDQLGGVYLTGQTSSTDFPTTFGAFDTTCNDDINDIYVTKLDLSGYPVPVVLSSFQARGESGFISLQWVTCSEVNCDQWDIYRAQREDGIYSKIGEKPGHGSAETPRTYQWIDRRVRARDMYFYKLKQVDFDGSSWWSHVVSATANSALPNTYILHQNYPNPFNGNTEIRYQLPVDSHVMLKIFNTIGQEVRTIVDSEQKAGDYRVTWDGRDELSREGASGLYFCRLKAGAFDETIKMVLMK